MGGLLGMGVVSTGEEEEAMDERTRGGVWRRLARDQGWRRIGKWGYMRGGRGGGGREEILDVVVKVVLGDILGGLKRKWVEGGVCG